MSTFALVGAGLSRDGIQARAFAFAAEKCVRPHAARRMAPENIHVAQLIVPGAIRPDAENSREFR
jgi:hypothetical protein